MSVSFAVIGVVALIVFGVAVWWAMTFILIKTNSLLQGIFWGIIAGVVAFFVTLMLLGWIAEMIWPGSMVLH